MTVGFTKQAFQDSQVLFHGYTGMKFVHGQTFFRNNTLGNIRPASVAVGNNIFGYVGHLEAESERYSILAHCVARGF